jgi:hypothetical protein
MPKDVLGYSIVCLYGLTILYPFLRNILQKQLGLKYARLQLLLLQKLKTICYR